MIRIEGIRNSDTLENVCVMEMPEIAKNRREGIRNSDTLKRLCKKMHKIAKNNQESVRNSNTLENIDVMKMPKITKGYTEISCIFR